MPYSAEEIAHWMNIRKARLRAEKLQKRKLVFKRSAVISLCILAVYVYVSVSAGWQKDPPVSATCSTGLTWTWKITDTLFNTTYTDVRAWVNNITPTNAMTSAAPEYVQQAPKPAPSPPVEQDLKQAAPPLVKEVPKPDAPPPVKEVPKPDAPPPVKEVPKPDAPPPVEQDPKKAANTDATPPTSEAGGSSNSTNSSTTDSQNKKDSSYTVLEVAGNVVSYLFGFTGEAVAVPPPPAPPTEAPTPQSETKNTPPEDAPPPLDSNTNDANKSETDSNYTLLEVAGDVVSSVCGFAGFMIMMALQQG